MGGYRGRGFSGASEKYPSRDAASSARSSAEVAFGAIVVVKRVYVNEGWVLRGGDWAEGGKLERSAGQKDCRWVASIGKLPALVG
jgi:hypothetical protein